ncbi:GTP-binding protein TrmE [Colletotrichum scovillei]|uniref:GTP-binding protein TrmE n=2 Tax=Colletotrichum scovillei TaxID=1209932 RepID=A0A9P7RG60_9PEZI|nr:GTP-binding protein TrmE [Colletotrichum scovillei]KAG7076361.1 GTP-binding protein TrmE [Colletotrichum scovillei]KAG7083473.1 GTP-binding protein TrmE [Colletotrichum scovillei]
MHALIRTTRSLGRTLPLHTRRCLSDRGYSSLRVRPLALPSIALGFFYQRNTPQNTSTQSRFITSTSEVIFKEDTIYALSTAQGRAGIAVIRISGPGCIDVYKGLCPNKALPKPRYASVRTLVDGQAGEEAPILDSNALVLYFPGPKTVTGEDVLELHVHGGPATFKAVLAAIPRCASTSESSSSSIIRYAEPGEFTKRAFLNDRLDLAQVESLGDTLSADTEQQRRAAVRGSSGSLGRTYEGWREQLLLARGEIEALIDFSEDQHFDESPAELMSNVSALVADMRHRIGVHERAGQRSELLRNGIRIALLGPPNVGKSSLMNLVVGREASIVSMEAGTTRDVVEVSLDIRGYLCSFADTAGIRTRLAAGGGGGLSEPALGLVEEEGIRRAKQKASESDIIIVLAAVEPSPGPDGGFHINYDAETLQLASEAQACLIVVNKRDAVDAATFSSLLERFRNETASRIPNLRTAEIIAISCREAEAQAKSPSASGSAGQKDPGAIHGLIDRLVESFAGMTALPVDQQDLLGVTARQAQLLEQCRGFLDEFMAVAHPEEEGEDGGEEPDIVLAAEHLRYAADSLAKITGRVEAGDVEEVLGVIFEK